MCCLIKDHQNISMMDSKRYKWKDTSNVTKDAVPKPITATRIHRTILKVAADVAVRVVKLVRHLNIFGEKKSVNVNAFRKSIVLGLQCSTKQPASK